MTALLQISTDQTVYIVDPFPLFTKIQKDLKPILEDPLILKIMHGAANDYKQMQKDFGIYAIGIIDTQLVYNEIRTDGQNNLIALCSLCKMFVQNYMESKSCTLDDWRRRPLTNEMIEYAWGDVYWLYRAWKAITSVSFRIS
jgi:ribonuclease D